MGANQSSTSEHKVAELLFERGTDAVAVEVHSAAVDSEAVTVFTYFTDSKHRNIATNAIQAHKVLRHPSILKLMTFSESSSSCHVVTEPATPLCACIDYVNGWEITVGLAKILEALHFLHTQAGYSHNNVSMESIYVTPDGEWKLGRLDCVNRIAQNSKDHILSISDLCDSNIYPVPPANEQKAPVSHCRDISGLGKLCEILLDKMESFDQTWLSEFGEAIEVMISPELTEVPTAAEILTQPLLSNPLVLTLKFVEEITLKTETEKQEFFSSLTGRLRELPEIVIAKMLVRPLLRRFVVQEELAYRKVLPCLLTPKSKSNPFGLLSPSLFKKYLPPVILRLFTVKEFRVRILLLDHFHCFCHMLDKSRLEKFVMPLILQGLHDSNDVIVQSSLSALADLVPVLGGRTVIGTDRRCIFTGSSATKPSGPTREEGLFSELDEETTPNPIPTPSAVTDRKAKGKPIRKTRKQSKSEEKVKTLRVIEDSPRTQATNHEHTTTTTITTTTLGELPGTSSPLSEVQSPHINGESSVKEAEHSIDVAEEEMSDWDEFDISQTSPNDIPEAEASLTQSNGIENQSPTYPHLSTKQSSTESTNLFDSPRSKVVNPSPVTASSQSTSHGSMVLKSSSTEIKKKSQKIDDDFSKLDIKVKDMPVLEEIDFFADMAPKIKSSKEPQLEDVKKPSLNLAFALTTDGALDSHNGWGDDEDGWDW